MHNYFKLLKKLLFFKTDKDIEGNDLLFLEVIFTENDPVYFLFHYMEEDIKNLLINTFGENYVFEYSKTLYNIVLIYSKIEQITHFDTSCNLYSVIQIKDKLFKVEYYYRSHEGLYTDSLLSSLKEVTKKQRVIDYYESVSQ